MPASLAITLRKHKVLGFFASSHRLHKGHV
jgi:hypothetical protein